MAQPGGVIYGLLRWFTGIALHWFYSSIRVVGRERVPLHGPLLIAASHHNALVDALIAVWLAPRRLTLTAKATLMKNPLLAWLMSRVGVVPLRRASDEARRQEGPVDQTRNMHAFESLLRVLDERGAILIFPEGKSHSEPQLAPLKTGIARLALEARDTRHTTGLEIVPLGLSFEDKGQPGTSVLAEFGEPIRLDDLGAITVEQLTRSVHERLSAVSLKPPNPSVDRDAVKRKGGVHPIASPLSAWGEFTHRYIINYARDIAVRRSRNPDDPAMLTIIYSLVLILMSYVVQFGVVALLLGPAWALVIVATLPLGAYWAAFRAHPPPSSFRGPVE